jgi:hypothetical protein
MARWIGSGSAATMVASAPTTMGFGGGGSAGEPEKKVACGCKLNGFGFSRWSVEVRLDTLIRKVQNKNTSY